jgi:ribonuclease H / adenosylcobalamin/alpha-ribazole phosphatase
VSRRLVVEADGGSRGNPGPAAYGALVRDPETGAVLAERAQYLGETTNNVAEYSGLVAGLTAAKEIDPAAEVEVRMDSKLVVEQMTGRWKIKHEDMRRLALEARAILPVGQVTYVWVPRLQNSAADRLANAAMDAAARGQTWEPDATAYPGVVSQPSGGGEPTTDARSSGTQRLSYRLLTGEDTAEFCVRVSEALAEGYQLHGSPAITFDGTKTVVAQALVDPRSMGFGT